MPERTAQTINNVKSVEATRRIAPGSDAPALPPGWTRTTVGEIAEINPRDPEIREIPDATEVTFVPMAAVDAFRGVIAHPQRKKIGEVRRGYTPFREGDVLFAKITPSMENGKAAIAHRLYNGLGFGSTEFHILRPRRGVVLSEWLFYYVRQEGLRQEARASFTGTAGQLRVPARFLVGHPIPLAPLAEQRRIVARIEELFSQLDAAEEGLRRVQRNLKRYRAAVFKAAVEGRLVPTQAELARAAGRPYETGAELLQRILAERRRKWEEQEWARLVEKAKKKTAQARRKAQGLPARMKDIPPEEWQGIPEEEYRRNLPKDDRWKQKYKEPSPPDTANLPLLPEGWVWVILPQIGDLARGKSKHRPRNASFLYGGPYPFIQTGDVRQAEGYITTHSQTYSEAGLAQSQLWPAGTLCITIAANIAETAVLGFDACFPDSIVGFIPEQGIEVLFVDYYFRTIQSRIERLAPATAQKNINLEILKQLPVPLPPLSEQLRIIAEVERRLSVAREAEKAVKANLKRIARLRQAILKRAFEGKFVPQDPSDEPVKVLLERIRAGETEIQDLPLFQR